MQSLKFCFGLYSNNRNKLLTVAPDGGDLVVLVSAGHATGTTSDGTFGLSSGPTLLPCVWELAAGTAGAAKAKPLLSKAWWIAPFPRFSRLWHPANKVHTLDKKWDLLKYRHLAVKPPHQPGETRARAPLYSNQIARAGAQILSDFDKYSPAFRRQWNVVYLAVGRPHCRVTCDAIK